MSLAEPFTKHSGGTKKYTIAGTVSYKFEPIIKKAKVKEVEEQQPLVAWVPTQYAWDDSPLITTFDNTVFLGQPKGPGPPQNGGEQLLLEAEASIEDDKELTFNEMLSESEAQTSPLHDAQAEASGGARTQRPDYKGMLALMCSTIFRSVPMYIGICALFSDTLALRCSVFSVARTYSAPFQRQHAIQAVDEVQHLDAARGPPPL